MAATCSGVSGSSGYVSTHCLANMFESMRPPAACKIEAARCVSFQDHSMVFERAKSYLWLDTCKKAMTSYSTLLASSRLLL